jgi:hypothetical protein
MKSSLWVGTVCFFFVPLSIMLTNCMVSELMLTSDNSCLMALKFMVPSLGVSWRDRSTSSAR